jgi:CDP-glucose 4,6-dehydratase
MENLVIDQSFWKGRRVFLTGHNGFKGSWISLWLKQLGAEVCGYSLDCPTRPSIFYAAEIEKLMKYDVRGDIRDLKLLTKSMQSFQPEIVIHMAAQSLVRESYVDPIDTYTTNIIGTVNLFEAVRNTASVKAVLNITSDKCYENKELLKGYHEKDPMGGYDPYSSSKGCAELVSSAYRNSYFQESNVALATARSGNVIGGGDWANDRIVPDAIRAFIENKPLLVRNPKAVRPWQHVLEPLSGYLVLCQQLLKNPIDYSEAWNFGPNDEDEQPVSFLVDIIANTWGNGASWNQDDSNQPHEAFYLKLDCSKTRSLLKHKPAWSIEKTLHETVEWYKAWHNKKNMREFTICQIDTYQQEQN